MRETRVPPRIPRLDHCQCRLKKLALRRTRSAFCWKARRTKVRRVNARIGLREVRDLASREARADSRSCTALLFCAASLSDPPVQDTRRRRILVITCQKISKQKVVLLMK